MIPRLSVMATGRSHPVTIVADGNVISTGFMALSENIACFVSEYTKAIVSSFIKDIVLGE